MARKTNQLELPDIIFYDHPQWLSLLRVLDKNETRMVKDLLADFLIFCLSEKKWNCKIKTMDSRIDAQTYAVKFADSFVDSEITSLKVRHKEFDLEADMPKVLYHGTTTDSLHSIMRWGLVPNCASRVWERDTEPLTYLTESLRVTEYYAKCAAYKCGGYPMVLVLDSTLLERPELKTENFTTEKRLSYFHTQFIYSENIPPKAIKDFYILPKRRLLSTLISNLMKQQRQVIQQNET